MLLRTENIAAENSIDREDVVRRIHDIVVRQIAVVAVVLKWCATVPETDLAVLLSFRRAAGVANVVVVGHLPCAGVPFHRVADTDNSNVTIKEQRNWFRVVAVVEHPRWVVARKRWVLIGFWILQPVVFKHACLEIGISALADRW